MTIQHWPLLTLLANTLAAVSFYVNSAETHGLIADTVDLVPATWYNGTYTITGVTVIALGTVSQIPGRNGRRVQPVATGDRMCKIEAQWFKDWFLPSLDELHELYLQNIGNFVQNYYWCSSDSR